MPKSLSELKSSPDVGPLERTVSVCVAGKVVDEFDRVSRELLDVQADIEQRQKNAAEGPDPHQRMGGPSKLSELEEKADKLADAADALRDRVAENSVSIVLHVDDGLWRRWLTEHPTRDAIREDKSTDAPPKYVDPAGQAEDATWGGGVCNVAALVADLNQWVVSYNGEPTSDAWWDFVSKSGAPGDLRRAASTLIGMHGQVVDPGKSRRAWRDDHKTAIDSE